MASYLPHNSKNDPAAALAIVIDRDGRVLTVARPAPPFEQSIPGGCVEPGETPRRAALRELAEETGVIGAFPRLVSVASSPTDGRTVYVYLVQPWRGDAYSREGHAVAWLTPHQMVKQGVVYGRFAGSVFRALGLM